LRDERENRAAERQPETHAATRARFANKEGVSQRGRYFEASVLRLAVLGVAHGCACT
jgi:hypothetical protein